ncbi:MAG: hypothetical protein ACK5QC_10855 [Bacteroidota bacterium]|nr:hypothetical protein [Bacteroidota bacterium]MCA6444432.1 hypothetical protein [Bacteroidota bacterium]
MKKSILILSIAGLALASCRKDVTCECKTTSDAQGFVSSTRTTTWNDVKKKDAKKQCQSYTSKTTAPVASTLSNDFGMECTIK